MWPGLNLVTVAPMILLRQRQSKKWARYQRHNGSANPQAPSHTAASKLISILPWRTTLMGERLSAVFTYLKIHKPCVFRAAKDTIEVADAPSSHGLAANRTTGPQLLKPGSSSESTL